MSRAIELVVNEQSHHALCVRSPSILKNYKSLFELYWYEKWQLQDETQKSTLRRWYEIIESVELAAERDIERDYESAKRRSIILLADILETYVETLLQLMLAMSDRDGETIGTITGRRPKRLAEARDVRRSVQQWERMSKNQSRTGRFVEMICHFMPAMTVSLESMAILDEIFLHRNALTHELILVSNSQIMLDESADAAKITLIRVDEYFHEVGQFISATMAAWASLPDVRSG